MKISYCIAENAGLSFNGRRVSRDLKILENIKKEAGNGKICVENGSVGIFERLGIAVFCISSADDAEKDCIFFAESESEAYLDKSDTLVIYKFNRSYPADVFIPTEKINAEFELISAEDFQGASHEKITKEIYRRK